MKRRCRLRLPRRGGVARLDDFPVSQVLRCSFSCEVVECPHGVRGSAQGEEEGHPADPGRRGEAAACGCRINWIDFDCSGRPPRSCWLRCRSSRPRRAAPKAGAVDAAASRPQSPVLPKRCDYEALLGWLKLPRFGIHDTAHNWIDYFAPSLPGTKHLVVDRLAELVEFGAEPQNRQVDLFFAWWELEFMHQEKQRKMPIIPREPDDAIPVLTSDQMMRLGQYPKVMESISRFREGAARLKVGGWNQRSVMSLLGYAVGWSGPTKDRRHAALEACMVLQDGFLPESQRHFWGARGTRRRARAIGKMIQLFISLSERRTHGDWSKACADWRSDLAWVEATWIAPSVPVPVTPVTPS